MSENEKVEPIDYSFLTGGLLYRLLVKAGLARPGLPGVCMRSAAIVLMTYVPILILSTVQGVAWNAQLKVPFLFDIAETSRFLVVAPLLIFAEAFVDPWIIQLIRYMRVRLIPENELPKYESLLADAVRKRDSAAVEILLFISTFALQWVEVQIAPVATVTTWHHLPADHSTTHAYLWCIYFAKPLVRFLWMRWLWRYITWSMFLLRLSIMPLKIVPPFPDGQGGLGIIAAGHTRFAILALAFGAQTASVLAAQMVFEGKTLASFKYEIVGIVAIVLAVFLTPLLPFSARLLRAKRTALFEYGALADQVATAFHGTWISGARDKQQLLNTSEVQSLSALNKSYHAVRDMSICLIGKENITMFITATLIPFVPLLLIAYPFDELLKHVLKKVF
jgi:hypothetical protein